MSSTARKSPGVVLLTGASGGIGRALVGRLTSAGATVAALDRDQTVRRLASSGSGIPRVHPLVVDLSDTAALEAAVDHAVDVLGPIDILINNAGVMHKKPLAEHTLDDWNEEMAVNARAPFLLCRAVVPSMVARGSGIIVNVASIWANRGGPERAAYIAAKHALIGLTRAIAAEFGPLGIRVNSISPGPVRTPMTAALGGDQTDWLEPDAVADAIMFLCNDDARGMSGANVEVFGQGRPVGT
jgi:NAD(P)-dependent dehydrogenase (short-subunit alcohol dehydrogenase family)